MTTRTVHVTCLSWRAVRMAAIIQRLGGGHIQVMPATASHLVTKSPFFKGYLGTDVLRENVRGLFTFSLSVF